MTQTAKIFINGRSQAVRLPAAFRFDTKEVFIRQDPKTGDFVINSDNPKVHGQVIPKRFLQTEEANYFTLGGMRGTPTNRYDMLTNGARQ